MVLTFRGQVKPTAQIRIFEEGSPQEPSIAFANASSTGLFLANADTGSMGLASNGVSALEVTPNALLPAGTETYDLGSADKRFGSLWLAANTLHLGNVVLKEENGSLVGNGSGLSGIVAANITGLTQALDVIQATSVDVTGNVTASYFVGNGSYLEGVTPPLSITTVDVTDNTWTPVDDTAVSLDGGYIKVTGSGFAPGSIVTVDGTNASSTSYVSSSILHCVVGAKASGTYAVSVIRGDTAVATKPAALTYSANVTWVTASNLGNVFDNTTYTIQLQATSDSTVMYSNVDPLPPQTTLDSATGNLTGNITSVTELTVYSFDVRATDQELQDAILTCLLYFIYVALSTVQLTDVSWSPITQTALDSNSSGYLLVSGQSLDTVDDVLVGGTSTSFSKVGSTALRVAAPSKPRGTYDVSVVYGNQTKTLANAVYYSDVPVWSTSSALGNVDEGVSFNFTLEATSDSNVAYSNTTSLPPETTLDSTTGALAGTITSVTEDTLYNIGIRATDEEYQVANRTFLLQYLADFKITSIWGGTIAYHSAAISRDGKLYMWGRNNYGQLGLGHTTDVWLPTRVTGGSIAGRVVTHVGMGQFHTIVLCSDNTVHSCGGGRDGAIGNGGTSDTSTFVEITNNGALNGVTIVSLAAGYYFSLALSSTGVVYGWGTNGTYHELGLGDMTNRLTPVAITGGGLSGKTVISIRTGAHHSIVLASDGTVWTWGYNGHGQIGNNSTTNQSTPLNISSYLSGKTVTAVSVGYLHNVVLASDSSVLAWGYGGAGSMGDGGTTTRTTAVNITNSGALSGRTITKVFSSGWGPNYALASDGTVIGWGWNPYYQLLDGTQTDRPTPQVITPLTGLNITTLAGGVDHNLALSSTNDVYGWSSNAYGQVGDGTTTTASTLKTITNNFDKN